MHRRHRLVPVSDVARDGDRWLAGPGLPWLAAPGLAAHAGRWVRIRYRTGLFDEMVRPLVRFRGRDDLDETVAMTGALTGLAEWTGRVPDGTVEIAFSPVRRRGPFGFEIAAVTVVSRLHLLARGLRARPGLALMAIGARLIGAREEARHCLRFAALPSPIEDYTRWRRQRMRPVMLDGIDRPHADWTIAPTVHLLVRPSGDPAAWQRTRASLAMQSYPRWRALLPPAVGDLDEPRIVEVADDPIVAALGAPGDLVAVIEPGDTLLPHGLAAIVEAIAAEPAWVACYGDEEDVGGAAVLPRLKPDWSPRFEASAGYVGEGAFLRLDAVNATVSAFLARQPTLASLGGPVGHVRRLVWRRAFRPSPIAPACPAPTAWPAATVVIPTRDRPALLRACLAGLARTDYPALEIVIVDNGTVDPVALDLLDAAARREDVRVLRVPGPFDYAALCNQGAASGDAPLLVFLNNDVEVLAPDWLKRLARLAVQPDVGAVGPKLLFPDGRVQHGGDVMGVGGAATQGYRGARDGAGYLGQLDHVREAGGVTGAVQVVARAKFKAVGGFDGGAFPVLFNDSDLCLRLAARGWASMFEPGAVMVHAESATRGFALRPFRLHGCARAAFVARWQAVLRDDPHLHPALSLDAHAPALG